MPTTDLNRGGPTANQLAQRDALDPFVGDQVLVIDERQSTFGIPYLGKLTRNERDAYYVIRAANTVPQKLHLPANYEFVIDTKTTPVQITMRQHMAQKQSRPS